MSKIKTADGEMSLQSTDTPLGMITFAIMQTNFWVGDIAGNVKKMSALALDAKSKGADIVIFPELALIGYPPEDLLLRPTLAERVKIAMDELSKIEGIVIILGYPHIDQHGTFNSAAILQGGSQKAFTTSNACQIMASLMSIVILIRAAIKYCSITRARQLDCSSVKTFGTMTQFAHSKRRR